MPMSTMLWTAGLRSAAAAGAAARRHRRVHSSALSTRTIPGGIFGNHERPTRREVVDRDGKRRHARAPLPHRPAAAQPTRIGRRFLSSSSGGASNRTSPWGTLSPRVKAELEDRVLEALSSHPGATDPTLGRSVRDLKWVERVTLPRGKAPALVGGSVAGLTEVDGEKNGGDEDVVISLRLPSLLHPSLPELKEGVRTATSETIRTFLSERGSGGALLAQSDVSVKVHISTRPPTPYSMGRGSSFADYDKSASSDLGPGLANVAHLLAVYSCKGGVGKSTVAVNLAYELASRGGRIGLLDCDVYGPSLPVLVRPDDLAVRKSPRGSSMVHPIRHGEVSLMSLGYVSPNSGVPGSGQSGEAAVMRGPMASRVLVQLLKGTDWGDLDVLVLDLPPGTGDVQLTLCQDVSLSGAVCVTTPSELAVADAKKGVEMFRKLGVPTLAAVENMSYFDCPGGGRHYPFGRGLLGDDVSGDGLGSGDKREEKEDEASLFGLDESSVFRLPISPLANGANDAGAPLCLSRPAEASDELSAFSDLADRISGQILRMEHGLSLTGFASAGTSAGTGDADIPDEEAVVTFSAEEGGGSFDLTALRLVADDSDRSFVVRLFSDGGAAEKRVDAEALRFADPVTGRPLDGDEAAASVVSKGGCGGGSGEGQSASDDDVDGSGMVQLHKHVHGPRLFPAQVERKGRYGYAVVFADGATIIYSMAGLAVVAGGTVKRRP